jgi:hypothetical protein
MCTLLLAVRLCCPPWQCTSEFAALRGGICQSLLPFVAVCVSVCCPPWRCMSDFAALCGGVCQSLLPSVAVYVSVCCPPWRCMSDFAFLVLPRKLVMICAPAGPAGCLWLGRCSATDRWWHSSCEFGANMAVVRLVCLCWPLVCRGCVPRPRVQRLWPALGASMCLVALLQSCSCHALVVF